jgi:anti-anti-sigma regulatory factor
MKARLKRSAPAKTARRKPVAARAEKRSGKHAKAAVAAVAKAPVAATGPVTATAPVTVMAAVTTDATVPANATVPEGVMRVADAPVSADAFFLTLATDCTLRDAADLQFSLVVANGNPLVVDGSEVQRIDTAGAQLLVALALRQRDTGRRLEWKAASPELLNCGRRLGLLDVLGLAALTSGDKS